jgi:(1->4)-alpha-D-glucan 1-alpha-D-glucosylmutase
MENDSLKLYLTWRTLQLRSQWPELFSAGSYQPLLASGTAANHICAFARHHAGVTAVVAVPRLLSKLAGETTGGNAALPWEDTAVPLPKSESAWLDVLSGATFESGVDKLQASALFEHFPVALLVNSADMRE